MSMAAAYMAHSAPMGFKRAPRIRQSMSCAFIELVRPDCYDLYSIECQFHIFRWMVQTASEVKPTKAETGRWGVSGPIDLLKMSPSCVNGYPPLHIHSLEDLRRRFHFAVLARDIGPSAQRWRREQFVAPGESRTLDFPHYPAFKGAPLQGKIVSESDVSKSIQALLSAKGRLAVQLNSCHATATDIHGVVVSVIPQGFRFELLYGIAGEQCEWRHALAATPHMWQGEGDSLRYIPYGPKSETFIATLDRAIAAFKQLTFATELPEVLR